MKPLYIDLTRLKPEYAGGATRFAIGLTGALPEGIVLANPKNSAFIRERVPNEILRDKKPPADCVVLSPLCTLHFFDTRIKSILCIHDIQHEVHPANFGLQVRAWRKYAYRRSAQAAWRIQVSSEFIRKDIKKYYGDAVADKCFLAPEGYDEKLWSPELPDEIPLTGVDFPKRFVYYPAGLWKHKNHATVVEGLRGSKIALVLTGEDYGELENIRSLAGKCGVNLWTLGIIPESQMRWLYKNAICTVAAGYYESGSLPIKEALACGGKVLAADIEPNMDLDGLSNLWFFNTLSSSDFSESLKMVTDWNLSGNKDIENYRWSEIAKIYREVING